MSDIPFKVKRIRPSRAKPKPREVNHNWALDTMSDEELQWMAADMIRLLRSAFKLSYPKLGKITGVAPETLLRWENHQVRFLHPKLVILTMTHLMEQPKGEWDD